jgi:peptidoglycan hydrolase CwlO-like protein
LKAIAQSYSANNSVWPSPTVKTEARQLIADRVDSETSMMTAQLDSMQKSVEDLQNQITALAQKIQERHQSREILIDAQLETTLK